MTARIGIAAGDTSCVTILEAGPVPGVPSEQLTGLWGEDFTGFRDRGAEAGTRVDVKAIPDGIRVAWQVPRGSPVSAAGSLTRARRVRRVLQARPVSGGPARGPGSRPR